MKLTGIGYGGDDSGGGDSADAGGGHQSLGGIAMAGQILQFAVIREDLLVELQDALVHVKEGSVALTHASPIQLN